MKSEIVRIINKKLANKDDRICSLFANDPMFNAAYQKLNQLGDNSELLLDIIACACETKNNYLNQLDEVIRLKSINIVTK